MIEALPVLFIAAVAVVSYASALSYAADTSQQSAEADHTRLTAQSAWLQARLQLARQENWDAEMISTLADQLAATETHLAKINRQKNSRS